MAQQFDEILATHKVRDSRAKLINRDEALRTCFSGTTAPSDPAPVAGQLWLDTSTNLLKQYRGGVWRILEGYPTIENITALKALYAAEIFADGAVLWVVGSAVGGDCAPYAVKWYPAHNSANDDWQVFRPTNGSASSGVGRWIRIHSAPGSTFTNSDATPDIKSARICTTAGTPPVAGITDFDAVPEGHLFTVQRGSADCIIVHDATKIDLGGYNITLTTAHPRITLLHVNGVHLLVGGMPRLNPNLNLSDVASAETSRQNLAIGDGVRGAVALTETSFPSTTTPTGWVLSGWTVNDGLKSPASGGWSTVAKFDQYSAASRRTIRARVLISNLNAVFGISTSPMGSGSDGTAAIVDCVNGMLKLYPFKEGTTGTLGASKAIGFSLVAGREYILELKRRHHSLSFRLLDSETGASVTLSTGPTSNFSTNGRVWGKAGMLFISGSGAANNVTVRHFSAQTDVFNRPAAVVLGDSNNDGSTVTDETAICWRRLEMVSNRGNILTCGRSGETSTSVAEHIAADVFKLRPRFVVYAIGTNDLSDQTTWRSNVALQKALFEALGCEFIMCTVPPRTGMSTEVAAFNADIRGTQFGRVRYIDFAKALSTGNDGTTVNPTFNAGDGVHFNDAGHAAMYAQILADAPFLFDDYEPQPDFDLFASLVDGMTLANGTDATNDIDFSAGARVDSTKRVIIRNRGTITKQLDAVFAAGSGAGGRDPNSNGGSIGNGTWHAHAISNDGFEYSCDFLLSMSMTPTLPAGFKVRRYIGSILRESGSIVAFIQYGDYFYRSVELDELVANPGTGVVTKTLPVPTGVLLQAVGSIGLRDNTPGGSTSMRFWSPLQANQTTGGFSGNDLLILSSTTTIGEANSTEYEKLVNTSAELKYQLSASNADISINFVHKGWKIDRSRVL